MNWPKPPEMTHEHLESLWRRFRQRRNIEWQVPVVEHDVIGHSGNQKHPKQHETLEVANALLSSAIPNLNADLILVLAL